MLRMSLFAVAGGLLVSAAFAVSSQAQESNSYNYQPYDSFGALGAGANDSSGMTMNQSQLSQEVSGVGIGANASKLAAGGLSTGGVNGSSLNNAYGIIGQNTNTGTASNLGIATSMSVGSVSMPCP